MTDKTNSAHDTEQAVLKIMKDFPKLSRKDAEQTYELSLELGDVLRKSHADRNAERIKRESRKVKDLPPLTGLHTRFCRRTPPTRIKIRKGSKGFWRLPGVSMKGRAWDVPATGGYSGGWETGKALAYAYLKQAKESGREDGHGLQSILETAMRAAVNLGGIDAVLGCPEFPMDQMPEANLSLRGQLCGFIQTIGNWACSAAIMLVGEPHNLSAQQIVGLANRGLAFDQAAFDAHWHPIWDAQEAADEARYQQERRDARNAKRRARRAAKKALQAASIADATATFAESARLAA